MLDGMWAGQETIVSTREENGQEKKERKKEKSEKEIGKKKICAKLAHNYLSCQ